MYINSIETILEVMERLDMYTISTRHTGAISVYRRKEISQGWSLRLISQGQYTSITPIRVVDIYLIPRH